MRVFVEAADVELDEDDGLLWTSLQTAFPGCSGMYYRDRDSDCRSAVKFDGKRFLPPGGAWNDRKYYVTLSQRCHAGMQAFGSYENASKQFERSVTAVQKMLGSSLFEIPHRSSRKVTIKASPDKEAEPTVLRENVDPLKAVQEREQELRQDGRMLSPIEQQFVDLARISTGKDVIIDQQREEMRKTSNLLQKSEVEIKSHKDRCEELEAKIRALDEELNMLRNMSHEQEFLGDKCRYKLPLCLTFIDLKKAFDSVEIEAVMEALCLTFIDLKKAFDSVETEAVMEALLIALRRSYSVNHIHTITKLIEVSREYKLPLCLTFIDLKKAFGSVEIEAVIDALLTQGVPTQYIRVLRELYSGFTTKMPCSLRVKQLTSRLLDQETQLARTREDLEAKNHRLRDELRETKEKASSLALNLETATAKNAELSEQLQLAIVSRDLLTDELAQLRPLANAVDINNADGVLVYLDALENAKRHQEEAARAQAAANEIQARYDELSVLQTSVMKDNTRLLERNAELEARVENFDKELQSVNEDWKKQLQKEKQEWDDAHRDIETECTTMKKQLVDLQDVLATVTRDATENSRRVAELEQSRDELRRALEAAEFKIQAPLKRQIRTLSEDLRDSELKVSELSGLIAALTADAHNSQRDIGDIL
ncbi:unnamed protein product [Heligmosomoides polygyrus]|uniref:TAR DNA-binding protein 43 N-terminal domain-containing protein n=1 Tax=Heligmosomoides polygyrus TaxID=6339 RepID=A0A3P8EBR2_HELPZ|nr:unnamed protein product [Heligmosomoides polygyrus]